MILDQTYVNLKNQVIKAERRVLKELGFCVHVKHPHKLIVVYLKYLGFDEEKNREMLQLAWNYMNDSFRTDAFVRYNPETIACACISLSARRLNINMSTTPPWFVIFKVQEDDLIDACFRIMALYHRGKPNTEKLEAAVDELKKQYQDQRKKEHRNNSSPAVTVVDRSNGSSHNMWGGFIQRQVPSINSSSNADEKGDAKKSDGKSLNSTNNNNIERHSSKGRSRSVSRSRNSRSRSSDRHAKKKDRAKKRTRSRSSGESDYEKKSRKRWVTIDYDSRECEINCAISFHSSETKSTIKRHRSAITAISLASDMPTVAADATTPTGTRITTAAVTTAMTKTSTASSRHHATAADTITSRGDKGSCGAHASHPAKSQEFSSVQLFFDNQ